jgi:hypothetical protein
MTNVKDKLTNWVGAALLVVGAVDTYLKANAGQPINYAQLTIIVAGAIVAWFTGKNANGTPKANPTIQ